MTRKTLTFDFTPRGWHSFTGNHPHMGGCSSSWMEPEFRAQAMADYNALELALAKLTKPALVAFMKAGGRVNFCGLTTKGDLLRSAQSDQYHTWYPYVEEAGITRRSSRRSMDTKPARVAA